MPRLPVFMCLTSAGVSNVSASPRRPARLRCFCSLRPSDEARLRCLASRKPSPRDTERANDVTPVRVRDLERASFSTSLTRDLERPRDSERLRLRPSRDLERARVVTAVAAEPAVSASMPSDCRCSLNSPVERVMPVRGMIGRELRTAAVRRRFNANSFFLSRICLTSFSSSLSSSDSTSLLSSSAAFAAASSSSSARTRSASSSSSASRRSAMSGSYQSMMFLPSLISGIVSKRHSSSAN
mmetsp:Transcript_6660/g.11589  ORF Transcript_6660/g.11589 Transcript_6660/m.11589 type:complete len:241 (-) Transcript_6660:1330-2052(-)